MPQPVDYPPDLARMPGMNNPTASQTHQTTAYALLRVALGMNILIHGAIRLPNIDGFGKYLQSFFAKAPWVPDAVLSFGSYAIPIAEVVIGLMVLLGLMTRRALIAGSLLMIALTAGSAVAQQWDAAGVQLIYSMVYFVLLWLVEANGYSLDRKLAQGA